MAVPDLADVVSGLDLTERPMASAQRAQPRPADPIAALWHDCTVLREHRGDGHLAVLRDRGLPWPVPHLLAADRVDPQQQAFRGWSDDKWSVARDVAAGLDRNLADTLELETDLLAAEAYAGQDVAELLMQLEPLARQVVAAGGVPFPNAMGLLRLEGERRHGGQPPALPGLGDLACPHV